MSLVNLNTTTIIKFISCHYFSSLLLLLLLLLLYYYYVVVIVVVVVVVIVGIYLFIFISSPFFTITIRTKGFLKTWIVYINRIRKYNTLLGCVCLLPHHPPHTHTHTLLIITKGKKNTICFNVIFTPNYH